MVVNGYFLCLGVGRMVNVVDICWLDVSVCFIRFRYCWNWVLWKNFEIFIWILNILLMCEISCMVVSELFVMEKKLLLFKIVWWFNNFV